MDPEKILKDTIKKINAVFKASLSASKLIGFSWFARKLIVNRTRSGKGLTSEVGGRIIPLKKLAKSTKDQRAGKVRFITKDEIVRPIKSKTYTRVTNLSNKTTSSKSNLTATGQMLDSLKGKARNGQIIVDFETESRSGNIFNKSAPSKTRNSEIVEYQKDMGRIFLGLSVTEQRKLEKEIAKQVESDIKKALRA